MENNIWNIEEVEKNLQNIFEKNSEIELLKLLKENTFLFYELVERKFTMQPIFHEVNFGARYRCDFLWFSDRSDYPQWVLVEIEKPKGNLFNRDKTTSNYLKKGIEQIKNWKKYFEEFPLEKERIFKNKHIKFRYILVIGSKEDWNKDENSKIWRRYDDSQIEIRSMDIFNRAINHIKEDRRGFWCFEENPKTLEPSKLDDYIEKNPFTKKYI